MKTILHLSDLHLKFDNEADSYCKKLLDQLTTDIFTQDGITIDTVFITGDICFSGMSEQFSLAKDNFIDPLLKMLNLSYENIYIVPGNHDVERSKISISERSLRRNIDSNTLNDLCIAIENGTEQWPRLNSYRSFCKNIINYQSNILIDSPLMTVRQSGDKLVIHCLNSAWLAGDDHDYGNLRFENILKNSLNKYGKNKNNIVLMHHPIDWFHESERNSIARYFEKNVDAVFYGHMHQFEQVTTINLDQDITLKLQAGTLDPRSNNAGYSIIKLHTPNSLKYGSVIYRKYNQNNEKYMSWDERGINGSSDFSIDKRSVFDSSKFSELSTALFNKIQYSHIVNTGKSKSEKEKLSDIFIEPNLVLDNGLDIPKLKVRKIKNVEEIISHDGLSVISGLEQDGKTILLRRIQLMFLEKQCICNLTKIVFYINIEGQYNNRSKIINELLSPYTSHDLQTSFESKLKDAISNGNAVILIDNYHKSDKHTRKNIDDFIISHSNNKFIITCEREISHDLLIKFSTEFKDRLAAASLGRILRKDIRKLISLRPSLYSNFSEDEVFNSLIKTIDNSQLPHNHFVYSILLSIFEQKNNLVGILNESDIIENYIEILLHKHCMVESKNKPTYKIIIHFLGFICSKMLFNRKL
ncbi:metallophosphoesterase, partial [Vibrio cholerae]|nr:metallophosphoesterase [Vibrio cholerae]